ncbi:hypothetical protein SODALDRAFT_328794 [Sodiomyces alkalinus F11]|uniref:LCCL domain-containing protein n=1 Tax=Sodiomyces alkalinus (strain CBS 110278 / VKM F-3762 / F11) TaxID=1314773 RepID=A0A3N2PM19_SODAK|nr:hypothetical protein SODALDRAFT_328794 [Sodiomyces alkalinus F11]ROT35454.1 hypothetical protein SODALDRAFT_328794 [Sodiomyces alkalinus F11]
MAAPPNKTIGDLSGKWVMNSTLSDSPEPALALQGVSWMVRKAIGLATLTLNVKQYEGPANPPSTSTEPAVHIDISQTSTGGVKGTTEARCVDTEWRDHSDWLFGNCRAYSAWRSLDEIEDAFLKKGWLVGEAEAKAPGGKTFLLSHVENVDYGWTATQIWGFQDVNGERRYARNIIVAKEDKKVEFRLVYDWLGEEQEE